MKFDTKNYRNFGYDILINNFEPLLRNYIMNEVLIQNYGSNGWQKFIPSNVKENLLEERDIDINDDTVLDDIIEELNFLHLKDILIFKNNFKYAKSFFKNLTKKKFITLFDELNICRRKIAHAKSTFSYVDFTTIIDNLHSLCIGKDSCEILKYIDSKGYETSDDVPLEFYQEYDCQNNLPPENYDLDGGFVGREHEIRQIRKLLDSDQDRIITITGAGGVGKTALALKIAYNYLTDVTNRYDAIIWFSAKTDNLTDEGIIPLQSEIKSEEQLIKDIVKIIDLETFHKFEETSVPLQSFSKYFHNIFSSNQNLLIIDNLETIIHDDSLINFIKDIPRPSQVLITSRKGLGEIERRAPISDLLKKDAIKLFRIIAKERNQDSLLRLSEAQIQKLVTQVKCYPLLIKWSIGQVSLGKDINEAFKEIFAGKSEIAQFSFNDIFSLLSENSINILYSMILFGPEPISQPFIMHICNLSDDEFDDSIKELILASFVIPLTMEENGKVQTVYSMLTLTRGFVGSKLDDDEKRKSMLSTRLYHLKEQIQDIESAKTSYSQSFFSLGIKTQEEQVAFHYIKAAKNYYDQKEYDDAYRNFERALSIAPKSSYVLNEFSKFEYYRRHVPRALQLAKESVEHNPDVFHSWLNYGIMLRKNLQFDKAIKKLIKCKELNPNYLPTYNELGRCYSLIGEHDKANAEFDAALKQEKYPNYRHQAITYQFKADNLKRQSESFAARKDYSGQLKCLEQSLKEIRKGLTILKNDRRLIDQLWRIYLDYGIALSMQQRFEEGKEYLEKCLLPHKFGLKTITPKNEIIAGACFYLASFSINEGNVDNETIQHYIDKGMSVSTTGSKWMNKFLALEQQLTEGKIDDSLLERRRYGRIKFYDTQKRFGAIKSEDESIIFFLRNFRQQLSIEAQQILAKMPVSFIKRLDPSSDRYVAIDIVLEVDSKEFSRK